MWSSYPVLNVLFITFIMLTVAGIVAVFVNSPFGGALAAGWFANLLAIGVWHLDGSNWG